MVKTGIFICQCGGNISATVDVEALAAAARTWPDVVQATVCSFLCAEAGQEQLKEAVAAQGLERLVIAACSPRLHRHTFRALLAETELNPYLLEMANIREQCAWVHKDTGQATEKATALTQAALERVLRAQPRYPSNQPINKRCLVIGGGVAGLSAALDIAALGYPVTLVEREPSLGGKMAGLDKTFPSLDCAACVVAPQMAQTARHPLISVHTLSQVTAVSGSAGNFSATIATRPRYVAHDLCNGCSICEKACPVRVKSEFEQGMGERAAIYRPFAQAVPGKPVIDASACLKLKDGSCGLCEKLCPAQAIRFEDAGQSFSEDFGAIVVAAGYQAYDWTADYAEYGSGRFANAISGLQLERLLTLDGPTKGEILRPSDGCAPQSIAIISCVGSRDTAKGHAYCSRYCCMAAAKHARQLREKLPNATCHVFYTDVRAAGKNYEEFYEQAREAGAVYVRGRVAKIYAGQGRLMLKAEDTLLGQPFELAADLVVMETAQEAPTGLAELAAMLGISCDEAGWLTEAHPKLRPVETDANGIFICGTCHGPKDIADTVAQAGAVAAKVGALLAGNGPLQTVRY